MITQHVASPSDPDESKGWRFVWYLVSNPLWLFGGAALIGAFIFQAIALRNGSLSIVQTLLMTELGVAHIFRRFWVRQSVSLRAWTAAMVTSVAVSVFIVTAEPQGGQRTRIREPGWRPSSGVPPPPGCSPCSVPEGHRVVVPPCSPFVVRGLGIGSDVHQDHDRHADRRWAR